MLKIFWIVLVLIFSLTHSQIDLSMMEDENHSDSVKCYSECIARKKTPIQCLRECKRS